MQMNLHLLRVFARVVAHRSFSRAAESLFISQPAVSKAVRELEHQLGLPLIERGSKGVVATDAGRALFEHAQGIFALERVAVDDVRARVGQQRGRLVVGASTTIAAYWLPPYVAALLAQSPSIELRVVVGNTQAVSHSLIDCEIDLALVEGPVEDPRILTTHWRDEQLRIAVHPATRLARSRKPSSAALSEQTWLVREAGSGTREVTDNMMREMGIVPSHQVEIACNEGIAQAVAAGAGLAILPVRVIRDQLRVGDIKVLGGKLGPAHTRPLSILQLKERPTSPLVQAFRDALLNPHPQVVSAKDDAMARSST